MYDLPDRTLIAYLANPLFDKVDLSNVPATRLARDVATFATARGGHHPPPEQDALAFYFLNHAFHLIKARYNAMERLDEDMAFVANLHLESTTTVAKRLLFYSLVASIEEARFLHNQNDTFWGHLEHAFGPEVAAFYQKQPGGASITTANSGLLSFGALPVSAGRFATSLMSVFAFGSWSPGFGGRGWTPIAALVSDCLHGKISLEQFGDQAFSLEHNNGSMFNKGHLYGMYSDALHKILDIQDAGQIPQLIGRIRAGKGMPAFKGSGHDRSWGEDGGRLSKFVTPQLSKAYAIMLQRFPQEMGGEVDLALVRDSAARRAKAAAQKAKAAHAAWQAQQAKAQAQGPALTNAQKHANNTGNILLGGLPGPK